jgi:cysteine sulfinate desulfinase/cysteine desulfurase-like protein
MKDSFTQRKATAKKVLVAKEAITDLIGAKKTTTLAFFPSMEEVYLKVIYEILMPRAQRTGRNEILVPKGESVTMVRALKAAGRLGLSFKEIEPDNLKEAVSKRTLSLMMSWCEEFSGKIHPMFEIATLCEKEDLFLFVDATQSVGKVFFRFQTSKISMIAFTHKKMACVAADYPQMKADAWGESFDLEDFFALAKFAQEQLEMMDAHPMEYSLIKNEIIDRVEKGPLACNFLNKGAKFLYDRWVFSFDGVLAENLAYLLRERGIFVDQLCGSKEVVCLRFDLTSSKTQILERWDAIIETAKSIKEFSGV